MTRAPEGLRAIAVFKLIKAVLLLSLGFGAFRLLHRDLETVALHWVEILQADPNNRYIHAFLVRVGAMTAHTVRTLSVGSFVYGTLLAVEGTGLWFRRRWAEYFTVVATASFLPLECVELARHPSAARGIVLAVNAVIVWYLAALLRRRAATRPSGMRKDRRR